MYSKQLWDRMWTKDAFVTAEYPPQPEYGSDQAGSYKVDMPKMDADQICEQRAVLSQKLEANLDNADPGPLNALVEIVDDDVLKIVYGRLGFLLNHFMENWVIETIDDRVLEMWPNGEANGTVVVGNEYHSTIEKRFPIGDRDLTDMGIESHRTEEWESAPDGYGAICHYLDFAYRIERGVNYAALRDFVVSLSAENALIEIDNLTHVG